MPPNEVNPKATLDLAIKFQVQLAKIRSYLFKSSPHSTGHKKLNLDQLDLKRK